jgi:hypothetical protein
MTTVHGNSDMSNCPLSYFEHRAETELEMAQRATHPAVVRAHYQLADLYLDRVYGGENAGAPQEASDGATAGAGSEQTGIARDKTDKAPKAP